MIYVVDRLFHFYTKVLYTSSHILSSVTLHYVTFNCVELKKKMVFSFVLFFPLVLLDEYIICDIGKTWGDDTFSSFYLNNETFVVKKGSK